MWFSVLILSCEHSNQDLKWRAVLSRWNPLTCDHSNESHRALLQSYCLLCCTSWFEILSLWMNSLSGTCSQVKVSDRYFSLLLSAVGGGFERLGSLWNHGVIQTLLQFKSTVWIRLVVAASRTIKSHAYNTHDTTGTWIQSWTDLHINLLNGLTC